MADTIRIRRRTSGAPGAPGSLANAELAYNEVDHTLYYGEGTGGAGGTATTVVPIAGQGLASAALPVMDGTAAVGSAAAWSRGDHVHPSDTSRAPVINPAFVSSGGTPLTVRPQADPGVANYLTGTLIGAAANTGGLRITMNSAGAGGNNVLTSLYGGGSLASPSATPAGQNLMLLSAGGHDGSGWQGGAAMISLVADATWASGSRSSYMQFITTPIGSTVQTEAMRITSGQAVLIGATALVGGEKLRVNGQINATGLTGIGTPSNGSDAANKSYVDTQITNLGATYLKLTGGEITGNLEVDGLFTSDQGGSFGTDLANTVLFRVNGAQGTNRGLVWQSASKNRWSAYANLTNDSGSNVGSDFVLQAWNDAGSAVIFTPLTITRSTGLITTSGRVALGAAAVNPGDAVQKTYVDTNFLNLAGGTLTGMLTLPSTTPSNPQHAASKAYVDSVAVGLQTKQACVAATVGANITLSGTQTIDGVAVVVNDRVLVKDQTTPANNGIYVVASGAWTRSTDMDTWAEVPSAYTFISGGTVNSGSGWNCTSTAGGTLGTTPITWVQFSGSAAITGGAGLVKTGSVLDVVGTANRIVANADNIDIASSYVGQTSITTLGTVATGAWNGTPVTVPFGGTGVSSLTGYVKGAGAGPFTAAAQIPTTDISGLGTMALQNAISVAITGGSIDGVTFDCGTF